MDQFFQSLFHGLGKCLNGLLSEIWKKKKRERENRIVKIPGCFSYRKAKCYYMKLLFQRCGCVYWVLRYEVHLIHSLSRKVLAIGIHTVAGGSHEIPSWRLEVWWVYFLFLINVRIPNERAKWMGEERRAPKSPIFLSRCRNPGPESRETGPRSHSKMETFGFGKASPQSGLSFLFCPQPWKTWEAGGIWPGGQAVWGTWLWNVLGKQDAFSCRPNKPTGLCVARKGSGYLPSASVSFGLSSPAAKWPKRVRFDKSWKVRGGRWQDVRDQSLRDVPEPPLLHFLSKGWESQRSLLSPSTASPPPRLWPRPQTSHLISGGRG